MWSVSFLETLSKITELFFFCSRPCSLLFVSWWGCELQITQCGYDTPWILPVLSLRFRLECCTEIWHQGNYLSKLKLGALPQFCFVKCFGKLTNTLCFLLFFFSPTVVRIKHDTVKFFHIRFHAWLNNALIY